MGNIFNAVGELVKGRQTANQLRDQAENEQYAADMAKANRDISARQYSAREEALRRSARQALGAQRAAIAESGTGFGGSNLAIQKQSTANAELDALNLRYQGALERVGFDAEISTRLYNKSALRKGASQAMRLRWFNAASAFFGGQGVGTNVNTAPTTAPGAYGQGSLGNFGNNTGGFTATGSSGGYTGGGLSGGYGSIGGYNSIFGGG